MGAYLSNIYREIYEENFSHECFECRLKLQSAIYLIEVMGINVGNYSFSWSNLGPCSVNLDIEAIRADHAGITDGCNQKFSETAKNCMVKIHQIAFQADKNNRCGWMLRISSLHYLLNVFHYDDTQVIAELERRIPHLSDQQENGRAFEIAQSISPFCE